MDSSDAVPDLRLELPSPGGDGPPHVTLAPLKVMVDMFDEITDMMLTAAMAGEPLPKVIKIGIASVTITPEGMDAFVNLCKLLHSGEQDVEVHNFVNGRRAMAVEIVVLMDYFKLKDVYRNLKEINLFDYGASLMLYDENYFMTITRPKDDRPDFPDVYVNADTRLTAQVYHAGGNDPRVRVEFKNLIRPDSDRDYEEDEVVVIDISRSLFVNLAEHIRASALHVIRPAIRMGNPGKPLYRRMLDFVMRNSVLFMWAKTLDDIDDMLPDANEYTHMFVRSLLRPHQYPLLDIPPEPLPLPPLEPYACVTWVSFERESSEYGKPHVVLQFEQEAAQDLEEQDNGADNDDDNDDDNDNDLAMD